MATVFSLDFWQQGTFKFIVAKSLTGEIDERGNPIAEREAIEVSFYFRPESRTRFDLTPMEHKDEYRPRYHCRVTAVNGDKEVASLPKNIHVGDVGVGMLEDRPCRATVIDISQNSVINITRPVLGENVRIELDYSTNRAS